MNWTQGLGVFCTGMSLLLAYWIFDAWREMVALNKKFDKARTIGEVKLIEAQHSAVGCLRALLITFLFMMVLGAIVCFS